jgi:hypothetical protein
MDLNCDAVSAGHRVRSLDRPSKLVMRVRFPSPAPPRKPRSQACVSFPVMRLGDPQSGSCYARATRPDAHAPRSPGSGWSSGASSASGRTSRLNVPKHLGDGLVPVAGGVLVDHGRADAGVPEPGHQLLRARAGRGRQRAARVAQVENYCARGIADRRTSRISDGLKTNSRCRRSRRRQVEFPRERVARRR